MFLQGALNNPRRFCFCDCRTACVVISRYPPRERWTHVLQTRYIAQLPELEELPNLTVSHDTQTRTDGSTISDTGPGHCPSLRTCLTRLVVCLMRARDRPTIVVVPGEQVRVGLAKRYRAEPVASDLVNQVLDALPSNNEEAEKEDRAKILSLLDEIRRLEKESVRAMTRLYPTCLRTGSAPLAICLLSCVSHLMAPFRAIGPRNYIALAP